MRAILPVVLVSLLTGCAFGAVFYLRIRRHEEKKYARRLAIVGALGIGGIITVSRLDLPSGITYWSVSVIAASTAIGLLSIRRAANEARARDIADVRVESDRGER